MNRTEILNCFKSLSACQGLYSHLYNQLIDIEKRDPARYEKYMQLLEKMQFKDKVDLILYLEC